MAVALLGVNINIEINPRALRDAASLVKMRLESESLTHNEVSAILEGMVRNYLLPIAGITVVDTPRAAHTNPPSAPIKQ